jgi:hypothetical protein
MIPPPPSLQKFLSGKKGWTFRIKSGKQRWVTDTIRWRLTMSDHHPSLEDRLRKHPHLRERFEAIMAIVEDPAVTVDRADEAELLAIAEVRLLGATILQEWATGKELQTTAKLLAAERATSNGKKNSSGSRRSAR